MTDRFKSAEYVVDSSGRPYHIGVGRGDVAPSILLVGDPARAERCAKRFDQLQGSWQNREFTTFTGSFSDTQITVMATGIGCDNTEIAVIELAQIVHGATIIRAGTCGAVDPQLTLGELVVTWGAVRLESTSTSFVPEGYPAVAHPRVIQAITDAAEAAGAPWKLGMTATACGFYGAQGRKIEGFPPRQPNLIEELAQIGVLNLEMETSTLLTLASLAGFQAGAVCTVFAERSSNRFVKSGDKERFEDRAVDAALAALISLAPPSSTERQD